MELIAMWCNELCDLDDCATCHLDQFLWRQAKDGMRMTGGCPDFGVLEQILVDVGGDRLAVTQRRHATNRKASGCAHKVGVGLFQLLADLLGGVFFMHTVAAAGDDEQGALGRRTTEEQRLGDLPDGAAHSRGSVGGCAGRIGKFYNLIGVARRYQGILDALGARFEWCHAVRGKCLL